MTPRGLVEAAEARGIVVERVGKEIRLLFVHPARKRHSPMARGASVTRDGIWTYAGTMWGSGFHITDEWENGNPTDVNIAILLDWLVDTTAPALFAVRMNPTVERELDLLRDLDPVGPRTKRVFDGLSVIARHHFPPLRVRIGVGDADDFPKERDYAFASDATDPATIVVAPKMERAHSDRIMGVLAHELGHVVLVAKGWPKHKESDADTLAEGMFRERISYDADDVQTFGAGERPRPYRLG